MKDSKIEGLFTRLVVREEKVEEEKVKIKRGEKETWKELVRRE